MSTRETKDNQVDYKNNAKILPSINDWMCLVPTKLREELTDIATKAKKLETDKEKRDASIEELKRRISVLIRTSSDFCQKFLQFLHKQNEELRTIALAGQGSYEEAIPPVRPVYNNYDPWRDSFKTSNEYGGTKHILPTTPTENATANAAAYIEGNISGYINEFAANIVRKGRMTQVNEFIMKFQLHPITENDIRITRFNPFDINANKYARTEFGRRFGTEDKKITTRLEYFVYKFENDADFRTQVLADTKGKPGKPIPREVFDNTTALALHLFTIRMSDEEKDKYGKEFEQWKQDIEKPAEPKEGEFREIAFDHLAGNERRETIRAVIQSHMERITWLTSQLTA